MQRLGMRIPVGGATPHIHVHCACFISDEKKVEMNAWGSRKHQGPNFPFLARTASGMRKINCQRIGQWYTMESVQ